MARIPSGLGRWLAIIACGFLFGLGSRHQARADVAAQEPYAGLVRSLEPYIGQELKSKALPALSIALVDDQRIIWARGFGLADRHRGMPADADTIYRVGSVSKLFTALAIMQLVEQGRLDLDSPITRYLPELQPRNPFGKPITLRQMMAHRSGLARESPVGHYFDPQRPSLADTMRSIASTALIYEPGTHTKYSNAAVAAVGEVLERIQGKPFAQYVEHSVLGPIGMSHSGFTARPEMQDHLATGLMWTYDGRQFDPPTWPLGTAPAGNLYASAADLAQFLRVVFADGRGPAGSVVKPETLRAMMTPQLLEPGEHPPLVFGLGFHLDELDGLRRVGHGGSVYGFATEVAALPDEKLGAVVIASRDCANAITTHIADLALRGMLAVRRGQTLPSFAVDQPVSAELMKLLPGQYGKNQRGVDLTARAGQLFLTPRRGGVRAALRMQGNVLVTDDSLSVGQVLEPGARPDEVRFAGSVYKRQPEGQPEAPPERWAGLIGEYGPDHDVLYILEKEGRLWALIEWFFYYPLEEESTDVFRFPDWGLYDGEKLVFTRNSSGRATRVIAASVAFERREPGGIAGQPFRIQPVRPVAELRPTIRAAEPPRARGRLRAPELVELGQLEPTIRLDIRYATNENFLGTPVYESARAFLQRPAAEALARAHRTLGRQGYGLLIHDAYRPWFVTRLFWEATPQASRAFVADPAQGSRHNRGCAVDLSLYDLATGRAVAMPSGYDEFSPRAYPDYPGGTALERWHRELLRSAMEEQGFAVNEVEWWHYDFRDWPQYPILNLAFDELAGPARAGAPAATVAPAGDEKPGRTRPSDLDRLQGAWIPVYMERNGKEIPASEYRNGRLTMEGETFTFKVGDRLVCRGIRKLDPTRSPKALDDSHTEGSFKGRSYKGIYELEGDTFKTCNGSFGQDRPGVFTTKPGSGLLLVIYKREAAKAEPRR